MRIKLAVTLLTLLLVLSFTKVQSQSWSPHANGNDLFFDGGKVGIGFLDPNYKLDVNGTGRFKGSVQLETNHALGFEADGIYGAHHWISYNDGSGNFNLKIGNKYSGGLHKITENGTAFWHTWHQGSDFYKLEISQEGGLAGETATWTEVFRMYNDKVVFNEDSNNIDFRIESNGNSAMFFLDGGTNRIGIGEGTPTTPLHLTYADNTTSTTASGSGVQGYGLQIENTSTSDDSFSQLYLRAGTSDQYIRNIYEGVTNTGRMGFFVDNTNDIKEALSIANDGNVGIGTTSPDSKFMVHNEDLADPSYFKVNIADGSKQLELLNTTDNSSSDLTTIMSLVNKRKAGSTSNGGASIITLDYDAENLFSPSQLNSSTMIFRNDDLYSAYLAFYNNNSDFSTFNMSKLIDVNASQAFVRMDLSTQHADHFRWDFDGAEKMRINSVGNVGIGTTSPGSKLDVQIGASDTGGILLTSPDNTIAALQDSNGAGEDGILDLYSSGTIKVRIAGSSNVDSYIDAGNMGIGTTSPNRKLTVDAGHAATHARFVGTYTGIQGIQVERSGGDNIRLVTNYTNYGGGLESSSALRFAVNGNGINSPSMYVKTDGNVGIGTTSPTEKLSVNGTIRSKEVKVEASPWPDYVFEDDYNLRSLEEIEKFIQANNHLPEIPSAKEIEENGVKLGKMNALLLKKIEELTLHTIQQSKEIRDLKSSNDRLQIENDELSKQFNEELTALLQRIENLEKNSK